MNTKHHKTRISTIRTGAKPTSERRHHNGGIISEIVDRDVGGNAIVKRYKSVWDCPLDTYRDRQVISSPEHEAGSKFRNAYFRAVLGIKVDNMGSGSEGDKEMAMLTPIYSERLLNEAYSTLTPRQKAVVIDVCGHDNVAGETAKLKTLHRGLEKLCDLWKISGLEITSR